MLDVIAGNRGKLYAALTNDRPGEFESPWSGAPFVCSLWDHGSGFTPDERCLVARALLECGCRYAVCGGASSEAWHDAVDAEYAQAHRDDPEEALATTHVMTTWHNDEGPDEVGLFFVCNTSFDDLHFQRFLVLHLGTSAASEDTVLLFRPVGSEELALIHRSGGRAFPPRLPEQPFFYPVLSQPYAEQIARDWNVRRSPDQRGFVTRFRIRATFLAGYEIHTVGAHDHREYWIPADDLTAFNQNIVGEIEVIADYHGEPA